MVREQNFYRFADWWKFAARAPHRLAVARRGDNPQTISAPAFIRKVIAFYIFFHELFASPKWFSFSRQSLCLVRDWSTS